MKKLLLLPAIFFLSLTGSSQETIECHSGDTIVINLGAFRGSVQWEESIDNQTWAPISGETLDSVVREDIQVSHWLHALITEGTCEPFYAGPVYIHVAPTFNCPSAVRDIEGNIYNTIVIGSQCWTQENLKTKKFADGSVIPQISNAVEWKDRDSAAWCYYNNTEAYNEYYGKMYNQYTAADPRNVCPSEWHVPTDVEMNELVMFLGGDQVAGGKLKSILLWASPNTGADNSSGFNALPAGYRSSFDGSFDNLGQGTAFWSQTESDSNFAFGRGVTYSGANIFRGADNKKYAFSIRCLKN